jgi:hypothetical protein
MNKLLNILSILLILGFVTCKKDEKTVNNINQKIVNNKAYLDFLKDKSILDIKIVGGTKYIESLKHCNTCGSGGYGDTIQWTVVKDSSFETYLENDFIGVPQKDSKDNFYVGTYKSLYKLNESGNYELILNTGDFYFFYFTIDKLDNIWFFGDNAGIAYWDHSKLTVYNSQNSVLPANYNCKLVVDDSNTVWVASIGYIGLLKIESGKWKIIPGSEIPGFTEYSYLDFPLVDIENGIWFQVYDSDADTKFVRLKDNIWTLEYPPNSYYSSNLFNDSQNNIWSFSTTIDGDGNSGLWYYKNDMWNAMNISNINSKIITINADNNTIYIGTEKGLFEISR